MCEMAWLEVMPYYSTTEKILVFFVYSKKPAMYVCNEKRMCGSIGFYSAFSVWQLTSMKTFINVAMPACQ
jgi:hypothetical protein